MSTEDRDPYFDWYNRHGRIINILEAIDYGRFLADLRDLLHENRICYEV